MMRFRLDKRIKKIYNSITMEYVSRSVNDTYDLAKRVADVCRGGEIILLNGDLGAGKTTFTKGLAAALGVKDNVTSPTFTIMKEYKGRLKLYHFDLYRIIDEQELDELGFDDYLNDNEAVCVIEWNKYSDLRDTIDVDIKYEDENTRIFSIKGTEL